MVETDTQDHGQAWHQAEARVLGQIMVAQNIIFSLPDTTHIAEFYAQTLMLIPGLLACRVCLEEITVQKGAWETEDCVDCQALRRQAAAQPGGFLLTHAPGCQLGGQPGLLITAIHTLQHYFGFFVFKVADQVAFNVYQPFIANLASFVAITLENRWQGKLLQQARNELERKVAERTHALQVANQQLQAEIETRRETEKALRESEERYRSLVAQASDGIFVADEQGNYLDVNQSGCKMLGYTREEILQLNMRDLASPESQKRIPLRFDELQSGDTTITERELMTKSGRPLQVEISAKALDNGNLLGLVRDITVRKQTEQELQRTNNLLRAIIDAAPAAIVGLDLEGRVQGVWNPAAEQMFGWSAAEAIGGLLPSVPDDKKLEFQRALDLLRSGQTLNGVEVERQKRDGTPVDYGIYASPLHGPDEQVTGSVAVLVDVTERKRMDEALWESSHRLRLVLDNMPSFVFWKDRQSVYLGCNNKFAANAGLSSPEAINGMTDFDLPWRDTEALSYRADDQQVIESGIPKLNYEETQLIADGRLTTVRTSKIPLKNPAGEIIGILGTFEDITERRQAEEALQRLNRELRAISSCNQTLLRAVDEQALLAEICRLICDEAGYRMAWVGYAENDEAKTVRPVAWAGAENGYLATTHIVWADREHGRGPTGTAIRTGESVCFQDLAHETRAIPWRENAFQHGYRASIALPLKDEGNQTFGALTIYAALPNAFTPAEIRLLDELAGDLAFGITTLRTRAERRRAEQALWESSQMLRVVLDTIPAAVFWKDRNSVYLGCNQLSAINSGLKSPEEIVGLTDFDLPWKETHAEYYRSDDQLVMENGEPKLNYEETQLRADGQFITLLTSKIPLRNPAGEVIGVLGMFEDITERKQMAEALAAREQEFRTLAENSPDNIARYDLNCRTIYANPALEKTLQRSASELLGSTPVEAAVIAENRTYQEKILQVLKTGINDEMDIVMPDRGEGVSYHNIRFVAEHGADGAITGVQTIGRDITERKQAEEEIRQLNQELEQRVADRTAQLEAANKELEAFSYSVSHDLRAPLRHINGFLEMLEEHLADTLDEQSQHFMDNISEAAKRMGLLIDDLLSFSRMGRQGLSKTQVRLDELVEDVIREFKPETEGREVAWQVASLPTVTGDRAMLRIVLANLVSNALKYTRPRLQTMIEIGCLANQEKETVIFIRDNGVGFDMQYAHKLFGVFQRLHRADEFEGTGIGLANVQRIIHRHGGRTWAEAQPNQGATFYFSLPEADFEQN